MSNPAYGGLIKIGRTTKDPEIRRQDLSSNTATPSDFKIEYQALVEDHERIELAVHHVLENCRYSDNREFFQCGADAAIDAIRDVGTILHEENFYQSPEKLAHVEAEKQRALDEATRLKKDAQRKAQRQKEALEQLTRATTQQKRVFDRIRANAEPNDNSTGVVLKVLGVVLLGALTIGLGRFVTYQVNQYLF